jgi:NAD-dependent deacetylase
MRPHIVFFGEIPLEMRRIEREIAESTLMIVIGTSGNVYPAAGFVHRARQSGAQTVYIGLEPPLNAEAFDQTIEGKAGEVLPGLFCMEQSGQ